jgi:choline dehydrogenase-like flavoprotein
MLPYFRKTEHHHNPNANPKEHGHDGGMYTCSNTSTGRKYPLRQMVKAAWESIGLKEIPDANSGSPQGFNELVENRRDGLRQLASEVYPLNGVQVMTETLVNWGGTCYRGNFECKEGNHHFSRCISNTTNPPIIWNWSR